MEIAVKRISLVLVFLLMVLVGTVFLQIWLSRRESKWLGLVLPGICMIYPVIMLLNVANFGHHSHGSVIATAALAFFLCSLPALVLLAIYFACRSGRKQNREMEKMNIDDL